ncbi:hypothetical protein [Vibrio alfacsensis]|uniref:hypothetical protein n=1 Tax=Vibrio alfacsensis TaxID=1074311 RepID=UPI0040687621
MLEKGGSWYECDSGNQGQGTTLCLDDFHYYQQHLYGELILTKDSALLSFLVDYRLCFLNQGTKSSTHDLIS